ncbi:MAG: hypothetical protein Q9M97_05265 [Candidatus Gracilibacteria bacterium]|nr:hypothetical protein [Candidatus Gracilibacteria bacterium]
MEIEYKFKDKYNPETKRLEKFDYSSTGGYFITICTKNREEYFGEIVDGKMVLNEIGIQLKLEIENIPKFRKNVLLDEFVIMPNHIHFVIFLVNEKCRGVPLEHLNNNDEKKSGIADKNKCDIDDKIVCGIDNKMFQRTPLRIFEQFLMKNIIQIFHHKNEHYEI